MHRRRSKGKRRARRVRKSGWLLLALPAALLGYLYSRVSEQVLCRAAGRPAVRFRQLQHRWSRVALLDLDLACPGIRVEVAAAGASPRRSGCSNGAARTVADWCRATGAIGGINGGFFGREVGGGRKEIVGLLKVNGRLYGRAPRHWDRVPPSLRPPIAYAHSALGFDRRGRPAIAWVISDPVRSERLLAFAGPEGLRSGQPWEVDSGLSGGPRLILHGRIAVSDRAERLASSGLLPRTFVAYAAEAGVPRYLVLGAATAMTFQDAAEFLDGYFRRFHGLPCAEAMSLDGGPSSQLTYRANSVLHEAQASDVTVPTSLLVFSGAAPVEEAGLPPATSR